MMFGWYVWLLAALSVHTDRYVFELRGAPVGIVELSLLPTGNDNRYRYRSQQLFTRGDSKGTHQKEISMSVDARGRLSSGEWPESLWLWNRPDPGCVPGREELGPRTGRLCASAVSSSRVTGTVFGDAFEALYDARSRLTELTVGLARFRRATGNSSPTGSPPDFFSAGFPIQPSGDGPLALVPPLEPIVFKGLSRWRAEEARALLQQVHDSFEEQRPTEADLSDEDRVDAQAGSCIAHARRFTARAKAQGQSAAVIYGLVADGDRAFPHAWARVGLDSGGTLDLDPTTCEEVDHLRYLAIGATGTAGTAYLELLSGSRQVIRQPKPATKSVTNRAKAPALR